MKAKRIFALSLMALLLCLPVCSLAAVVDLTNYPTVPDERFDGKTQCIILDIHENTTLTGSTDVYLYLNASAGVTLTLDDVHIDGIAIYLDGDITIKGKTRNENEFYNEDVAITAPKDATITLDSFETDRLFIHPNADNIQSMTLNLVGTSKLDYGLLCYKTLLHTKGNGTLKCNHLDGSGMDLQDSSIIVDSGNIVVDSGMEVTACAILIDQEDEALTMLPIVMNSGTLIANGNLYAIGKWNYNLRKEEPFPLILNNKKFIITAGEDEASAKEVNSYTDEKYLKIVEIISPELKPELPKTGDNSNVILWLSLICISLLGMTTLVSKRKNA